MSRSRKINSSLNISFGLIIQILGLFFNFISRTVFIKTLGAECLGLNGLFSTILSLMSLADLGIGEAIAFYLYRPIKENDNEKLRQLILFFKKCYLLIGTILTIIGLALIPLLPHIVNFENNLGYNLYLIYILYVSNTVITYFLFSYPPIVINANQKKYVISIIGIIFSTIILISDITSLYFTKNYIVYLVLRLFLAISQNFVIFLYAKRKYPYVSEKPVQPLDKASIKLLFKDIYGLFVVKASAKAVDSTDNLFISIFLGTVIVGYNSNYLLFFSAAASVISVVIYSFSASVGDYNVERSRSEVESLFNKIDTFNFGISFAFAIFLFSFLNPFIYLLWGEEYLFDFKTVCSICFYFYLTTSLHTVFMFRSSLGLFRKYRYFFALCALTNLILDYFLIQLLGVFGLYLASIISNVIFAIIPFVKSLYSSGFGTDYKRHLFLIVVRYLYLMCFAFITVVCTNFLSKTIVDFVIRVIITIGIVVIGLGAYLILFPDGRNAKCYFISLLKGRRR